MVLLRAATRIPSGEHCPLPDSHPATPATQAPHPPRLPHQVRQTVRLKHMSLRIERFRCNVNLVIPRQGTKFRVNTKLAKEVDVSEPFEDTLALEIWREVNHTTFAIIKDELNSIATFVGS